MMTYSSISQFILACLLGASATCLDASASGGTGHDGREMRADNWQSFGRAADEDHYSPLTEINAGTAHDASQDAVPATPQ